MTNHQSTSYENSIKERIETTHLRLERFHSLASLGDVLAVYRGRPIWVGKDPKEIMEVITNLSIDVPVSREAVLNFIGNLIHEHVHNFYLRKEKSGRNVDITNLEKTIREILKELKKLTEAVKSNALLSELLKWIFQLLAEIGKQNRGRPITVGVTNDSLLSLFRQCPSIIDSLNFLNHVFALLLKTSTIEAISILMDASKHGEFFDWIWLHLANIFPNEIVGHLLKNSAAEFLEYCTLVSSQQSNPSVVAQIQAEYRSKLRSLCVFFTTLAQRRNAELRNGIKHILEDFFNGKDINSIIFYIKLCMSPDFPNAFTILLIIADDLHSYINSRNLIKLLNLSQHPFLHYAIPPTANMLGFLTMTIRTLNNLNTNLLLLENLLMLLKKADFNRSGLNTEVINGIKKLINELFTAFLSAIHIDPNYKSVRIENLPILDNYVKDPSLQQTAVEIALQMKGIAEPDFQLKDVSHGYFKLLHTICIVAGSETTAQILARMLYTAKDHNELSVLVSFSSSIAMFYPNVMTSAVEFLLGNHRKFLSETRNPNLNVRFMKNLFILVEWHRNPEPNSVIKQIGFCLPDLCGYFQEQVLGFALMYLNKVKSLDANSNADFDCILDLLKTTAPRSALLPKSCHKILTQFSSVLITLLKLIDRENFGQPYDGMDLIYKCFDLAMEFIRVQNGQNFTVKRHFLVAFMDEIFGLFRLSNELNPNSNGFHSDETEEYSFLKEFRSMAFNRKAAAMAHSGVFKKPRLMKPEPTNENDLCKRSILIDLIDRICVLKSSTEFESIVYDIPCCKLLGQILTENICGDALAGYYKWEDWEIEKENIPRCLEVAKKVYDNPVLYDFLLLLAEAPYPCFWTISPIIRALLSTSLMYFESTPLKEGKPNRTEIEKLDALFTLFIKSEIAPIILDVAYEMICSVSNHEVYAILWDLWNFVCQIVPTDSSALSTLLEQATNAPIKPPNADNSFLASTLVLVIQRNITNLGHLLPLIVDEESWNTETNSNDWSIDRLLPVISAPENIKR